MFAITPVKLALAGAAVAVVGFMVYLDSKRRSAPDYEDKVTAKRQSKKSNTAARKGSDGPVEGPPGFKGDPTDTEALKEYFMQQMAQGQTKLESHPQAAVEHFANAVRVYGEPAQLLQILQQRLPAEHFMLLIEELNIHI